MLGVPDGASRSGKIKYKPHVAADPLEVNMRPGEKKIPCGKCIGCRLQYSKDWAMRCMLEAKYWEHNQFVTLTYDPECVPVSSSTGIQSLLPNDLTKFEKDLRRYYKYHFNHDNIRLYACGEYGSILGRPHFHLILFNLPVPDKRLYSDYRGHKRYTSEIILKIWKKGFTLVEDVTFESCAYVARYILKKQTGKGAVIYEQEDKVPEFTRCSRRPGIAANYYYDHKEEIYYADEIILKVKDTAKALKPAKYYDRKYDIEQPEKLAAIKELRRIGAEQAELEELRHTDLTKRAYYDLKRRNKEEQIKKLIRPI